MGTIPRVPGLVRGYISPSVSPTRDSMTVFTIHSFMCLPLLSRTMPESVVPVLTGLGGKRLRWNSSMVSLTSCHRADTDTDADVSELGILATFKGSDPSLKPLIL